MPFVISSTSDLAFAAHIVHLCLPDEARTRKSQFREALEIEAIKDAILDRYTHAFIDEGKDIFETCKEPPRYGPILHQWAFLEDSNGKYHSNQVIDYLLTIINEHPSEIFKWLKSYSRDTASSAITINSHLLCERFAPERLLELATRLLASGEFSPEDEKCLRIFIKDLEELEQSKQAKDDIKSQNDIAPDVDPDSEKS